jgi:hypothetical protein
LVAPAERERDASECQLERVPTQQVAQIVDIAAVEPERKGIGERKQGIGCTPGAICNDNNRPNTLVMGNEPAQQGQLLPRARSGNGELNKAQVGCLGQTGRVQKLAGRIAKQCRVEQDISAAAHIRRAWTFVDDAR